MERYYDDDAKAISAAIIGREETDRLIKIYGDHWRDYLPWCVKQELTSAGFIQF